MAKNCRYNYIENTLLTESQKDFLQNTHEGILKEVKDSELFRWYKNFYIPKKSVPKKEINNFLAEINNRYPRKNIKEALIINMDSRHPVSTNLNVVSIRVLRAIEDYIPSARERDINYFNGDEALMQQEEIERVFDVDNINTVKRGLKDKDGNNIPLYYGNYNKLQLSLDFMNNDKDYYGPGFNIIETEHNELDNESLKGVQLKVVRDDVPSKQFESREELEKEVSKLYPNPTSVEINYFLNESLKNTPVIRVGNKVFYQKNSIFVEIGEVVDKLGDFFNSYSVIAMPNGNKIFLYKGKEYTSYDLVEQQMVEDGTIIMECK